jgi:hypothetical protein
VGPILGLVLLYEIHRIDRFADQGDFLSYARLVRCQQRSAVKTLGTGGKKNRLSRIASPAPPGPGVGVIAF